MEEPRRGSYPIGIGSSYDSKEVITILILLGLPDRFGGPAYTVSVIVGGMGSTLKRNPEEQESTIVRRQDWMAHHRKE
jgi:hypothetical protein